MSKRSDKEIMTARNQCAEIVAKYGERYLPVFIRLEKELIAQQEKQVLMKKALGIATQNVPQFATQIENQKNITN